MSRIGLLVGVLVTVVAIAWLAGVFDTDYTTVDVPDWNIERDRVDRITLRTSADTLALARIGDMWRVTSPVESAVDSTRLNRLMDELEDMSFGSVVSTSSERHARYGVDSTGPSLVVRSGDDEKTLFVGDTGADYETVYVRLGGDDRVLSTTGRISVDAAADAWRDRTIISVPAGNVLGMRVEVADGGFNVSRASGRWMLEEAGDSVVADSGAVVRWIRRFAPLTGIRFETNEEFEAASPLARVTFETAGGSSAGLELRESETDLLARRPGSADVLTISSGMRASIVPQASSLRLDR